VQNQANPPALRSQLTHLGWGSCCSLVSHPALIVVTVALPRCLVWRSNQLQQSDPDARENRTNSSAIESSG
jgi:hypothetical protein